MKARIFRPILGITIVAAMSLSCSAVSAVLSTPTAAPELPTATSGNGGSGSGGGGGTSGDNVLLSDDFSDSSSGWGTGTDAQSTVEYVNGGLHMQNFKTEFITWSNPDQKTYENVHMEVTAKPAGGDTGEGFGLMCNQQVTNSAYYYFVVRTDGKYAIGKSSVAKDDVFLTNKNDWASSDLIAANASSYRIGADCGTGGLVMYVGGKKIDSVSDTSYTQGGVGLFLWSRSDFSGEVTYDDFVMTALK